MRPCILIISIFLSGIVCSCKDSTPKEQVSKEKIIREYFSGWEKKDWSQVEKNLAEGFTFTSPNDDDHISIEKFKEKCWVQANYIQRFTYIRFAESGTGAYITYQLFTNNNNNTSFRNTEYFDFVNGKIKSIEVFFGAGEGSEGFPSNQK